MQRRALIQVQDVSGNWQTVTNTVAQDQIILRNLDAVSRQYKRKVRAIDTMGNLLQLHSFDDIGGM